MIDSIIGVAAQASAEGDPVELATIGVYQLPKASAAVLAIGTRGAPGNAAKNINLPCVGPLPVGIATAMTSNAGTTPRAAGFDGSQPAESDSFSASRFNPAATSNTSGYLPNESVFYFPSKALFMRQNFEPFGWISKYICPPPPNFTGLSEGFMFRHFESVRGIAWPSQFTASSGSNQELTPCIGGMHQNPLERTNTTIPVFIGKLIALGCIEMQAGTQGRTRTGTPRGGGF